MRASARRFTSMTVKWYLGLLLFRNRFSRCAMSMRAAERCRALPIPPNKNDDGGEFSLSVLSTFKKIIR